MCTLPFCVQKIFSNIKTWILIQRQPWVSLKYQGRRADARFLPKISNQGHQQQSSRGHTGSRGRASVAYIRPWEDPGPAEPQPTALVQAAEGSVFLSLGTWQCSKLSFIEGEILGVLVPGGDRRSWSFTQISLLCQRDWKSEAFWPTFPELRNSALESMPLPLWLFNCTYFVTPCKPLKLFLETTWCRAKGHAQTF